MSPNPLYLKGQEAGDEIRKRLESERYRQRKVPIEHAWKQVIRIYRKLGDNEMADLLEIDWTRLSRFL